MPTRLGEFREDQVVELITSTLAAGGAVVEMLGRPDRDPERADGLTVDLALAVDGVKWAIDVMALRWGPELEGAVQKVFARLERELAARIEANQTLILHCHPSRDPNAITALVELATAAIEASADQWRGDEAALLRPRVDGLGAVEIHPWLSSSPHLFEAVSSTSGRAIEKKLSRQFERARKLGHRTGLVLDQRGAEDLSFGTNFMPSPTTILSVIENIEREAERAFDGLLLIDPGNALTVLRWPQELTGPTA